MDFNHNYTVFDFETTGFDPKVDKVVQISALKMLDGERSIINMYVKSDVPLSAEVTKIHGITNEMLEKEGANEYDAWLHFANFIDDDTLLISHNAIAFDVWFLEEAFNKHFGITIPRERYRDTAMVMKAKKMRQSLNFKNDGKSIEGESHWDFCLRIKNVKAWGIKYSLTLCCQEMGIDTTGLTAHTADADVLMTEALYLEYLRRSKKWKE